MKYTFNGRPVVINSFNEVYDRNGNALGVCVKTPYFKYYLVGEKNKGPIEFIDD